MRFPFPSEKSAQTYQHMYNSTKMTARFVHCPPFTEIRI